MDGWLTALAKWCRLPVRGGFTELDQQIEKLRMLRDSYQAPIQEQRHIQMNDVKKREERLCIQ
ncbi:MAG: hypothetical protein A2X83_02355 [Desulfuromonadales bacterium GWD2_54_10]|nr:MAG: hypothetical protein A2X83_02355 [Desulfuromonadales bacterium GWD2_54_10]